MLHNCDKKRYDLGSWWWFQSGKTFIVIGASTFFKIFIVTSFSELHLQFESPRKWLTVSHLTRFWPRSHLKPSLLFPSYWYSDSCKAGFIFFIFGPGRRTRRKTIVCVLFAEGRDGTQVFCRPNVKEPTRLCLFCFFSLVWLLRGCKIRWFCYMGYSMQLKSIISNYICNHNYGSVSFLK